MKIYRQLSGGSRYHYYLEQEGPIVRWYPEIAWQSKSVTQPEGRVLAQGSVERVLFEIRDMVPPDLLKQIRASLEVWGGGVAAEGAPGAAVL